MKATKITENSTQLTRMGLMNCYLVRESDGLTLVDTTIGGAEKDILAAAQAAGAPIKRILLTHAHGDHVGSVDALMAQLPGVTLAASERSLPMLRQPPDKSLHGDETTDSEVKEIKGSLPGIKSVPTHLIQDGELFGSLRCIATPGHCPGHFSFLDERDGTLFAGDELFGVGKLSVSGNGPWYFPISQLINWSKRRSLLSAKNLLNFNTERFACGHGKVQPFGTATLQQAIVEFGAN